MAGCSIVGSSSADWGTITQVYLNNLSTVGTLQLNDARSGSHFIKNAPVAFRATLYNFEDVYKRQGTWEGDIDSLGANVLAGVARMVVAFGDQLRDETFKERVGFMSVRQLSRIAKERGAGSLCYAEAMLVAYNRKCKYTLRMTKLHSGKVAVEDDFVEENEEPLADDPVLEE